ncbi:unnamed protein product [Urochloa humidicola]
MAHILQGIEFPPPNHRNAHKPPPIVSTNLRDPIFTQLVHAYASSSSHRGLDSSTQQIHHVLGAAVSAIHPGRPHHLPSHQRYVASKCSNNSRLHPPRATIVGYNKVLRGNIDHHWRGREV